MDQQRAAFGSSSEEGQWGSPDEPDFADEHSSVTTDPDAPRDEREPESPDHLGGMDIDTPGW